MSWDGFTLDLGIVQIFELHPATAQLDGDNFFKCAVGNMLSDLLFSVLCSKEPVFNLSAVKDNQILFDKAVSVINWTL